MGQMNKRPSNDKSKALQAKLHVLKGQENHSKSCFQCVFLSIKRKHFYKPLTQTRRSVIILTYLVFLWYRISLTDKPILTLFQR